MKKILTVAATTAWMISGALAGSVQGNTAVTPRGAQNGQHQKSSPFLIKQGLPHMTKLIKQNWDDPDLALTSEQKEKLLAVRKDVVTSLKRLTPQIVSLKQEIIHASQTGSDGSSLKDTIDKLASLEAEATQAHLNCIARSKAILSPRQLERILPGEQGKH